MGEADLLDHIADSRRSRAGSRSRTDSSPTRTSPSLISTVRLTIRIAVVLPQPEWTDEDASLGRDLERELVDPPARRSRRSASSRLRSGRRRLRIGTATDWWPCPRALEPSLYPVIDLSPLQKKLNVPALHLDAEPVRPLCRADDDPPSPVPRRRASAPGRRRRWCRRPRRRRRRRGRRRGRRCRARASPDAAGGSRPGRRRAAAPPAQHRRAAPVAISQASAAAIAVGSAAAWLLGEGEGFRSLSKIERVVGAGAVAAEPDRDPGRARRRVGEDAADRELHVGDRIGDDGAAPRRRSAPAPRRRARRRARARCAHSASPAVEVDGRAHAVRGEAVLDLLLGLGEVDVDRAALALRRRARRSSAASPR